MRRKITLIGAGSVVFAKRLVSDILQFPELSDSIICLMDIDPARLKVADVLMRRIVQKLNVPATVEATLDQREAIRGASYVICTIQVGGYKPGTVIDFEIPKKYGLQQTIADTLGVGGVFRGLRTIPVINSIGRDIAEVGAPDCLLLNYTNPMAMNCWGVHRAAGIPHVGLCHSVQGTSNQLATYAALPPEDVTFLVAGINHMAFFLKFEYQGQDAYPLLFRLLEDPSFTQDKVRFEMMRRLGYFVTESSEHQSEYVPYFIHHGESVIRKFDIPIDEYIRRCEAIIGSWEATERKLIGEEGDIQVEPQSHEYGAYIIHSMETNTPRVIYGNVPNRNLITNLPAGCCVEVPCLIDAQGVQPTHIGNLPPQLAAICRTNINVQELTVEAALTGKREHIYHAVMLDPHAATVCTLDQIWAMCDELIEAHQKAGLLGDFKPVIRDTGRSFAGTGDRCIAQVKVAGDGVESTAKEAVVEVEVTNPGGRALRAPLRLITSRRDLKVKGGDEFTIQVPARSVKTKKLTLLRNGADSLNCTVDLECSEPSVLRLGTQIRPRTVYHAGSKEGAAFSITLHGFPAVEGILRVAKGNLEIEATVEDSKITIDRSQPWTSSSLEFFVTSQSNQRIRKFYILPETPKPAVVAHDGKPVKGAKASLKVYPAKYEIKASVPLASIDLDQDSNFLFDILAGITALGDAHSGGRGGLNGSLDSWRRSSHYALAKI